MLPLYIERHEGASYVKVWGTGALDICIVCTERVEREREEREREREGEKRERWRETRK